MKKYLLIAVFLLSGLAHNADAATYYVSEGGSGTRDGSSADNACGAFNAATCTNTTAGDTVYLCGTFTSATSTTKTGAVNNYIIYDGSCPGGTPANFAVSGGSSLTFTSARYAKYQNINFSSNTTNGCLFFNGADDITIYNNTISCEGGAGINFSTSADSDNVLIEGNTFYNTGKGCITLIDSSAANTDWNNLRIINNNFIHCNSTNTADRGGIRLTIANGALTTTFTNPEISGNYFDDCSGTDDTGICLRLSTVGASINSGAPALGLIKNPKINRNYFAPGSTGGMSLANFLNGQVASNTGSGFRRATGAIVLFTSRDTIIENNNFSDNTTNTIDGGGIDIDHGNFNVIVRGNLVYNMSGIDAATNSGYGIMVLDSTSTRIYGNILLSNKHGIFLGTGGGLQSDTLIANNTISGSVVNGILSHTSLPANTARIYNNIIANGSLYGIGTSSGAFSQTLGYNNFYNNAGGAYQGQARSSTDTFINPQFEGGASTTASSFKLRPISPLISAGAHIYDSKDFYGRAFEYKPSVGAYEHSVRDFIDYFGGSLLGKFRDS